jgi:serine/threonine-protein kinase
MPASTPGAGTHEETPSEPGANEPPALVAAGGPRTDLDMDWDEEDEKTSVFEKPESTTVYERSDQAGAAFPPGGTSAFRSGYPSPAGSFLPPPNPPANPSTRTMTGFGSVARTGRYSSVPPSPGRMGSASPVATASLAPPSLAPPPLALSHVGLTSPIGVAPPRRNVYVLAGIGLFVLIAASLFAMSQRSARVAVFISSTSGRPLSRLAVYVDGVQRCNVSPCTLELRKGLHAIKASADGYAPQEQGTSLSPGEELAVNFKLERASLGTGIKVGSRQDGVDLYVDGKAIGPLPQELKDLAPGRHSILLRGNDRYAPEERTVNIDSDEIKDLGMVALKVVRGLASFDVRTPGVKVTLVSGKDRRQLTDFSQPVEIETSKTWTIEATKPGFDDFRQPITFEDRAEKKFLIMLQERTQPIPVAAAAPAYPRPAPEPRPAAPEPRAAAEPATGNLLSSETPEPLKATAPATCTLNFNSIPVSNVVLDGRPVGGTPKLGVSASAGAHTVLFVGPDEGRKLMSVTCKPGELRTVAVRLNQQ